MHLTETIARWLASMMTTAYARPYGAKGTFRVSRQWHDDGRREKTDRSRACPVSWFVGDGTPAVVHALEEQGVSVVWLNAAAESNAPVAVRLHEQPEAVDFVIADLTEANPNVLYETGFAHAFRKPFLPVIESQLETVPSTLHGRLFFDYDEGHPQKLITFLGRWMERYLPESRIEEVVG